MNRLVKFRKLVVILVIISLSLTLAGCKKNNNNNQNNDEIVPTDREITLIWWNMFESKENIQPLIDAYQAKHPNVTIDYSQKDPADYQSSLDKVLTDGIAETTPDIFTVQNTQVGRYEDYMIAAPTQVITGDKYKETFYPVVNNDLVIDNFPRAIPLGVDSMALIYNKKLLQAKGYSTPSDDWFELLTQAKNLTQKQGGTYKVAGLSIAAEDNSEFWFEIYNLLLMQSGVDMANADGTEATFADDPAVDEALGYFKSYVKDGVWDKNQKKDVGLFLEGKLAMYMAPSWRLLDIIKYNEEYSLGIDYGVAAMPQLDTLEDQSAGWAPYWAQAVAVDSPDYKVAWDFLNFATQSEQLRLLGQKAEESRAFGQMYPRVDMKADVEANADLKVYINEVAHAKNWNMVDSAQVKEIFKDWVNGEVDDERAQSQVSDILSRDGKLTNPN